MKKVSYPIFLILALFFTYQSKAQNVGINTDGSTPDSDALLHLKNHSGSALSTATLRVENTKNSSSNTTGIELLNSATTNAQWLFYIPQSGSTDLCFSNNSIDRITITTAGNVGIGNTNPTATLDVDGSAIFNESGAAQDFRIESDANTHMLFVNGANNAMGINTSTPASGLEVNTSMGLKVTRITSTTTLDNTHNVVLCNTGPYTVYLPAAASNTGKVYYIKNIDSDGDYFTIDGNSTETIDGDETFELLAYNHAVRIISDGSGWHILDEAGKENKEYCGEYFEFTWQDVTNPVTGKTWMDRSLGTQRVALSKTDDKAYGDLYQWGRLADGHQCRNSGTTTTLSSNDVPGHGDFILISSSPYDWRNPKNDNLWQGVNGDNNPCPRGYRIPTSTEWDNERLSWGSNDPAGAFGSPLKLPLAGFRIRSNGSLSALGSYGDYWSSTVSGTSASFLRFNSSGAGMITSRRAAGYSVRCIKD